MGRDSGRQSVQAMISGLLHALTANSERAVQFMNRKSYV